MLRYLIWEDGEVTGWACSNCRWRFPVPTLMSGAEAKVAYDRLADAKFREHKCAATSGVPEAKPEVMRDADTVFADRARMLIKRGYTPKVAIDLVLHETEVEYGKSSKMMEKARADAEEFLRKIRKGLI